MSVCHWWQITVSISQKHDRRRLDESFLPCPKQINPTTGSVMLCKGCSMNHSVNYLETSKMVLVYVLSVDN